MSLRKFKFLVVLFLISILSMIYYSTNLRYYITQNYDKKSFVEFNDDTTKIKTSKISTPIHIDNNWSLAEFDGICTGEGTFSNPYRIQNLEIDGNLQANCITIENSQDYFIIENCTLYNAGELDGWDNYMAGIILNNVQNGTIRNNTCTANLEVNIALLNCQNITLNNNTIIDSGVRGINVENSNNLTINYNKVIGHEFGILFDFTSNVTISNNQIIENIYGGIELSDECYNFTISDNILINSELGLSEGYNVNILNNTFTNCLIEFYEKYDYIPSLFVDIENKINGFPIYQYKNEVGLTFENFTYAGLPSQIILYNCNNSIMNNLNFSYGLGGISIFSSNNNIIRDCNLTDNEEGGILLSSVFNLTIENNILYNNEGIHSIVGYCHNSTFNDNQIAYTDHGIEFNYIAYFNNISNNNISFVDGTGINFDLYGDFNVIKNNTLINNDDHGINIHGEGNILMQNKMTNCGIQIDAPSKDDAGSHIIDFSNKINGNPIYYYGDKEYLKPINFKSAGSPGQILLGNCSHSILSDLIISHSSVGISLLFCDNNTIIKNTLSENMVCGLSLFHSVNNTVFDNDLNYNDDYGLHLYESNFNNITENRMNGNGQYGIYLDEICINNTIIHNKIIEGGSAGILLQYKCENNTIKYNTVKNIDRDGIRLYYKCYYNIIAFNEIYNNGDDGIEIRECNNTLVLGNNIYYNGYGYSYSFYYGMHYYNGYGVYLVESFNNTVTENEFLGNKNTIIEVDCNYNNIYNNYYLTLPPADNGDDDDDDDEARSVIFGYNISILCAIIIIAMAISIIKSRKKLLE